MAITEVDQIDAIGREDDNLRLLIIDFLDWVYEDMHLELLQDKINHYLSYLESKQYQKDYGDNFNKIIIDIRFRFEITENCAKFIDVVSKQLNPEHIFIDFSVPDPK
jgi:hypothetical protein